MIKTYTSIPSVNENAILNVIIFAPNNDEDIKGMIQVCHGMTEHMDRYNKFAEYFTARGYVVFGNDIISHGKSICNKTFGLYLDNWFDAVNDVENVRKHVEKSYPGLPVYLLGFSLGSFIVRCMLDISDYEKEILIGTGNQPCPMLSAMSKMIAIKYGERVSIASDEIRELAFGNYNKHFKNEPENYWLLTDDKEREAYESDPLVTKEMTPKFFSEFLRGMAYASKQLKNPNNTIPTLFLYGRNDPVGDFGKGVRKVYKAYYKNNIDTEIDYFEGTHDILHDGDVSNDVFETILRYLEK